jgi:hypothetical protein
MDEDKISQNNSPGLPGQPGNHAGGRPRGSPNRFTTLLREAMQQSFEDLGGVEWLKAQGKKNPGIYIQLLKKLLPDILEVQSPDPMKLQIELSHEIELSHDTTTDTDTPETDKKD